MRTGSAPQLATVVILSYNYGRYLRQCIESVLAQDYEPMEIVVVDDGSTDDSRAIIQSYSGRLTASFKQNGGMVSTMNRGFELSHGSVVVFLDADDFLLPDAVSAHMAALRDPGVVRSQIYMTVLNGTQPSGQEIPGVPAGEGDLRELTLRRGPGAYVSSPNSGNAWSRRFLDRVFPLPEEPRSIGAETYLMDTAPLFGRVATFRHGPKAVYRFHSANMNGVLVTMTDENIRRIIIQYEARVAWLASVARSLGYSPQVGGWISRNWRLLTLNYLASRMSGDTMAPSLAGHLRPTLFMQGNPLKRPIVALAILCIRFAPLPLSRRVAGRIIKLRYM
jgi:glycosyltransferase involved in cell wall biosynthesis